MAVIDQHHDRPDHVVRRDSVRWLHEDGAADADIVGSKAANLAVSRRAGLPVIDGFAVTVAEVGTHLQRPSATVAEEWGELSAGGRIPLVVRSSSPVEDLAGGSMAGVFDSVVDVRGWDAFVAAYRRVVASGASAPMAVLVQRLVTPAAGGVLFGVDPVSGRDDRMVIAAVEGGPHHLVSGEVEGRRTVVSRSGRVVSADGDDRPVLSRRHRRQLVDLAQRLGALFGGPQDVEWAIDDDRLLLLQSRPVTAVTEQGVGPILGPGPVAETFPDPLTALEVDLWIPPLRAATIETIRITGTGGRRRIARSPVVTVVQSQAVVDLQLTGVVRTGNRVFAAVDPRPGIRRLAASWRVGRLRGALAELGAHVIDDVDRELVQLPDLGVLGDAELLRLLDNTGRYLRTLHTHEMLAGALLRDEGETIAGAALREIARGRAQGWSDEDIVARTPIALAVVPASTGARPRLPEVEQVYVGSGHEIVLRERLRLRVRWVHELSRQVVREIGGRLVVRGVLADIDDVRHLRGDDLPTALAGGTVTPAEPPTTGAPLPARFRLAESGTVVTDHTGSDGHGVGAGGGRSVGPVSHGEPAAGDVLVVRTLDPGLAAVLGRVAGIVAETGSPLSHLAILAREHGVPTVVGFPGALERFSPGTSVVVDGSAGTVETVVAEVTA